MRSDDAGWILAPTLRAQQPEAAMLLAAANERAWSEVPADLLELVRLRIAMLLGNQAGLLRRSEAARAAGLDEGKIVQLADYPTSPAFSTVERACLAFTEQFVIDVSSLTAEDRSALARHVGEARLPTFVMALYVTECTQRLEVVAPRLLDAPADGGQGAAETAPPADLMAAMDAYQACVVRAQALDAVTTEMVRLRCARTHNCRYCRTLRLENAVAAGVDDAMTAKIDAYERSDLDERTKIALRITDAFITRPDALTPAVASQARAAFSPAQRAEMLLDITKWSTQKFHVAMGLDAPDSLPKNEHGVSFFSFDGEGQVAGFAASPGAVARP